MAEKHDQAEEEQRGTIDLSALRDLSLSGDYRISDLDRIGFEVDSRFGMTKKPSNSVITGHAFAQKRMANGWGMTVGLGTGFLAGIGAPKVRLFAGISYALSIIDHDVSIRISRLLQKACDTVLRSGRAVLTSGKPKAYEDDNNTGANVS